MPELEGPEHSRNPIQLAFLLDGRRTQLTPRLGNKHLIPRHMPRRRMMPSMTDPPRMIRNEEDGMQDPSGKVVDGFRGGKGLVAGFVSDDPESGTEESHPDGDGGVDSGSDEVVGGFREVATEDMGPSIVSTHALSRES
jgi:hypothetical protein